MRLLVGLSALALSGCATARIHSEAELDRVSQGCGMDLGEVVQEEELKQMLFVYRVAPTPRQRVCAFQWARRNHMRLTVIEAVNGLPN